MPIYAVHMWFQGNHKTTVEANDEEHAEAMAIDELTEKADVTHLEVNDATVVKSSCQYTDQQELEDRERDHEQRT